MAFGKGNTPTNHQKLSMDERLWSWSKRGWEGSDDSTADSALRKFPKEGVKHNPVIAEEIV